MKIRIAHSPDADDAFMFYALARNRVDTGSYEFEHILSDIETLNREALKGTYEVSAVSIFGYPKISGDYKLMSCGASMGDGYGPVVVSKNLRDISGKTVAVPGELTSANLSLKLYNPTVVTEVMDFDKIMDAVATGEVDAGVVIHEGQLTYPDNGLMRVVDLGSWWKKQTGLPLPLGGNVIRRDLGKETMEEVTALVKKSIEYALNHEEEALEYALQYSGGLDRARARKFVRMYVNAYTQDYSDNGRTAVKFFLKMAHEEGLLDEKFDIEFVG